MNFAVQRQTMVDTQLKTVGVSSAAVLTAMGRVPRERHVPAAMRGLAYADAAIEVARGRWLLEPLALGLLLTHAHAARGERVLVIGAATGYSAAVCAAMGMATTALESDPALAAMAREAGVATVVGDLAKGWADAAPYDLILFEGAIEAVPGTIAGQLAAGGRAAAIVRDAGVGRASVGPVVDGRVGGLPFLEVAARPLPGFARPRVFAF